MKKFINQPTDAIAIAAIENPLPFPPNFFDLAKPIPPKIQPKSGIKKEHTKPAIAIPLFFGVSGTWVF